MVLSRNIVFLLFSLKWKQKQKNPIDIPFQWPQWTESLLSSKCLTSNCCLVFVLTSYREALWLSCVCNGTNWKHFFSGPLETKPTATHFKTFTKTSKNWNKETFDNLIIRPPLFVYQVHWVLTAAGSSRRFTTGNSCNVCHMCSHHQQSRKLLRSDLHLPQDSVYLLCERAQTSGHYYALRPQIKGSGVQRSAVRAMVGLEEHAEFCSHSLSQPLGMQRIFSPVKFHPACLSWTGLKGCYRKDPPLLFIEPWQMGQRRRVS